MKKLFGTDGIRGQANRYPMIPEMALALGQAVAAYFVKQKTSGRIVIGKDTRRSSYMFEYALSAGLSSMGAQAILTGPLPTPGIAFLTKAMRADAGIVISASHNPFDDNGIKFFDNDGFKLPDEIENQIESYVLSKHDDSKRPVGAEIGRAIRIEDAVGRYVEFVKSTFPKNLDLTGLSLVLDCANGAAYQAGPLVLSEMGANVIPMGIDPSGVNINDDCGALHPEAMARMVVANGADMGIALDGDADRVILCDHTGAFVDGDQIMALAALEKKRQGHLTHNTVVGTVMSNCGIENYLKRQGISLVRTSVGDRYIVEEMRKKGFLIGGEPSGHLIFMDSATTGDGLVAALQVLAVMVRTKINLQDLVSSLPKYPQKIRNVKVAKRVDLESHKPLQIEIAALREKMGDQGRVVVRYSGTEPLLRLMIEAKNEALIDPALERLETILRTF